MRTLEQGLGLVVSIGEIKSCKLTLIVVPKSVREFPGGPVVRTLCFHCGIHGLDPWPGELRSCMQRGQKKKKVFYSMIGYLLEKVTLMEDFTLQSFKE